MFLLLRTARAAPLPATLRISAFTLIAIFYPFDIAFLFNYTTSKGAVQGILLIKIIKKSRVFIWFVQYLSFPELKIAPDHISCRAEPSMCPRFFYGLTQLLVPTQPASQDAQHLSIY